MRRFLADQRGAIVAEALFVLVILTMLLFGALELGRAYALKHSLDVAAHQAGRYLSLYPSETTNALAIARDEVARNIGASAAGTVVLRLCDGEVVDSCVPPTMTFGRRFRVEIDAEYTPVANVPFVGMTTRTLTGSHTLVVEKYP